LSLVVTHFSAWNIGGAGSAARHIHDSVRQQGIESKFVYRRGKIIDDTSYSFHPMHESSKKRKYLLAKQHLYLLGRPSGLETFDGPPSGAPYAH